MNRKIGIFGQEESKESSDESCVDFETEFANNCCMSILDRFVICGQSRMYIVFRSCMSFVCIAQSYYYMYCIAFGECLYSTIFVFESFFYFEILLRFFVDNDEVEFNDKSKIGKHSSSKFWIVFKNYLFGKFFIHAIACLPV